MRWTEEQRSVLRERYANEDNAVLAKELGVTEHVVYSQAHWLGLHKSREYESARRRRQALAGGFAERINTAEAVRNRVESRGRRFKNERARVLLGMEQKTRMHLRFEPREKLLQRNRLQRLGYVVDEAKLVAYWTPETRRATRLEKLSRGEKSGRMKCFYDFAELKENA